VLNLKKEPANTAVSINGLTFIACLSNALKEMSTINVIVTVTGDI